MCLSDSFIEEKFTYHPLNLFKVYNWMVLMVFSVFIKLWPYYNFGVFAFFPPKKAPYILTIIFLSLTYLACRKHQLTFISNIVTYSVYFPIYRVIHYMFFPVCLFLLSIMSSWSIYMAAYVCALALFMAEEYSTMIYLFIVCFLQSWCFSNIFNSSWFNLQTYRPNVVPFFEWWLCNSTVLCTLTFITDSER